jgi:hypothetical protein
MLHAYCQQDRLVALSDGISDYGTPRNPILIEVFVNMAGEGAMGHTTAILKNGVLERRPPFGSHTVSPRTRTDALA